LTYNANGLCAVRKGAAKREVGPDTHLSDWSGVKNLLRRLGYVLGCHGGVRHDRAESYRGGSMKNKEDERVAYLFSRTVGGIRVARVVVEIDAYLAGS
jgi:hypothetical protein